MQVNVSESQTKTQIRSLVNCSRAAFEEYRIRTISEIRQCILNQGMTPSDAAYMLSRLDELYTLVHLDFIELESEKERIDSIIRQCERSKTEGRNEIDRKKNATVYLENYPVPNTNETVDMYESWREVYYRYNHLKHCLSILENKQDRMITLSGYMKIDASFTRN